MKKKGFIRYNLIRLVSWFSVAALLSSSLSLFVYYGYSVNLKSDHLSKEGLFTDHNLRLLLYSHKGEEAGNSFQINYLKSVVDNYGYDYIRFAKVTEDGDLENIYETEYDSIEMIGTSFLIQSNGKQFLCLTENPDKAGKRVYRFGNDPSEFRLYARCDEAVAKARENSGKKGLYNSRLSWGFPYGTLEGYRIVAPLYENNIEYEYDYEYELDLFSRLSEGPEELFDLIFQKLSVDPADYYYSISGILNYKDNTVLDVDVYPLRSDEQNKYDNPEGKIDTLNLPDTIPFCSYAYAHDRPDKIFEKYKEELFPERSVLKEMRNKNFESVDIPCIVNGLSPVKRLTEYGPLKLSGTSNTISDEGYLVDYGYLKVNDELYLYTYILPYAGFWDSFGVNLLVVAVIIFAFCIAIALLSGIRPYRRYSIIFGRTRFKSMLLEALANNIKSPVNDIAEDAVKLSQTEDPKETDTLTDRVLSTVSEMNKTVEDVLKVAEIKDNKVRFRVNDVVRQAASEAGIGVGITDGLTIKADRLLFLAALTYLMKDASDHVSTVEVHIHHSKTVISFDTDNYHPGKGIVAADRSLSMANMQLMISYDGKKVEEEIRYRSRYET